MRERIREKEKKKNERERERKSVTASLQYISSSERVCDDDNTSSYNSTLLFGDIYTNRGKF